jgi:hypothetical protein
MNDSSHFNAMIEAFYTMLQLRDEPLWLECCANFPSIVDGCV